MIKILGLHVWKPKYHQLRNGQGPKEHGMSSRDRSTNCGSGPRAKAMVGVWVFYFPNRAASNCDSLASASEHVIIGTYQHAQLYSYFPLFDVYIFCF